MQRLAHKVAVITGGANGIGRAAALKFVNEGARVIIWDVNTEKGAATLAELNAIQPGNHFARVDTTQLAAVEAATAEVLAAYGQIDILVNNAGITRDATLAKMTPAFPPLQKPHRQANFAVLRSPDIPSVLVEMGFLSNRDDERALREDSYQRKLAGRLTAAVDSFFAA